MALYVDVERSPEALQEDEELIEAVNELMGTVSVTVRREIRHEISVLLEEATEFAFRYIPMLIEYREDPSRIGEDLKSSAIFLALLLFAVWFLAPSRGLPQRKKWFLRRCGSEGTYSNKIDEEESDSDGRAPDQTEESDEERFEKLYVSQIAASNYHRLVLPPTCKLMRGFRKNEKTALVASNRRLLRDFDDPAVRLQNYLIEFWGFVRSLLYYDYAAAGRMLIHWLQGIRRIQRLRTANIDDTTTVASDVHDHVDEPGRNTVRPETPQNDENTAHLENIGEERDTGEALTVEVEKTPMHLGAGVECVSRNTVRPETPQNDENIAHLENIEERDTGEALTVEEEKTPLHLGAGAERVSFVRSTPLVPNGYQNQRDSSSVYYDSYQNLLATGLETPSNGELSRHFFESAGSKLSLQRMNIEFATPDKNGYILDDDFLPDNRHTPLLVFVNSRSGPQQGHLLITQLRRLLNPIQVWDLAHGSPVSALESFLKLSRLRILVCGGDGTVSWVINTLEKMKIRKQWPPIAILPLGTGNDLAHIHGWGWGYNNESLIAILEQISESYVSLLDRWEVTINDKKSSKSEVKGFINYLGVGADAQAALHVHHLRESRPEWFFSRLVNKAMYGVFGAEDIIKAANVTVRKEIKLIADGVEIPLPSDSQGIILLNIDAYAGGVPLWSHGVKSNRAYPSRRVHSDIALRSRKGYEHTDLDSVDDLQNIMSDEERLAKVTACDRPSSCQDGYLDVVSIRGAFHLGQIKVGLSNAQRLCQCREAVITIRNQVAVQLDGEPWRQRACKLTIRRKPDPAVMLHRSADDGGVETEMSKLLDWAEERNMIDSQVHAILMKEFSRRIESKTRQRRVRSQDNIMSTFKKVLSSGGMVNLGQLNNNNQWQGGGGIAF